MGHLVCFRVLQSPYPQKIMGKCSKSDKRRVNYVNRKMKTRLNGEFVEEGLTPFLEDLNGIGHKTTRIKV